jgi:hypothetical protein
MRSTRYSAREFTPHSCICYSLRSRSRNSRWIEIQNICPSGKSPNIETHRYFEDWEAGIDQ